MKKNRFSVVAASIVTTGLINGCQTKEIKTSNDTHAIYKNINLVKILNYVGCYYYPRRGYEKCSNEDAETIQRECINKGYDLIMPKVKALSARSIEEPVESAESIPQKISVSKDVVDKNGIVTTLTQDDVVKDIEYKITGKCYGSEYIIE